MRGIFSVLAIVLIIGCIGGADELPTATPLPDSVAATPTPTYVPATDATPTPTPESEEDPEYKITYLTLREARCLPESIMLKLSNTLLYRTGTPLMQIVDMDKSKVCLEFNLDNIAKNQEISMTRANNKFGVEPCSYESGNYVMAIVEVDPVEQVWFSPIQFSC